MSTMRVPANTPLVSIPQDRGGGRRYGLDLGMVPQREASSAAAFGGAGAFAYDAMARGLNDVGRLLTGVSIDIQEREDKTRALEAYNELQNRTNLFLYGDGSPESGLYNRNGNAVLGSVKDTRDFFDNNVSALGRDLTPNARKAFEDHANLLRQREQERVAPFEAKGRREWEINTLQGSLDGSSRRVLDVFADPAAREEELALSANIIRAAGIKTGKPPELIVEEQLTYRSKVMMAGAGQLMAKGDFGGAMTVAGDASLSEAQRLEIMLKAIGGEVQARVNAGDIAGARELVSNYSGGIVGASAAYGGKGPRGIRNNNPGNIIKTSSAWAGEVQGGDSRFKSFATPEHGIAAVGKNLQAYNSKGINTVRGIIHKWAPPKENDTGAYVNAVAKALGVSADAKVDVKDPVVLAALTEAIIKHENGAVPYSKEQIQAGVEAALGMRELAQPGMTDGRELAPPAGLLESGNIDLNARPVVHNDDGSISTVRTISVNMDGQEILIPTISEDGRIMSDDEAVQQYLETGKHFGKFDTAKNATAYAEQLHEQQASQYLSPAAPPPDIQPESLAGGILPPDKVAQLSDMIDRAEKTQHEAQVAYGVQVFTSSLPEALAGVPFEQWDSIARGMAAQYPLEIRNKALDQWKDIKEVYQDKVNMNDAVRINNALAEYKDRTVGEVRLAMEARKEDLRQAGLSPNGFAMLDTVLANYDVETQENIKAMNELRSEIARGVFNHKSEDYVRASAYERGLTQGQADKIVEFFNKGGQSGMIYANKAIIDYYGKYYLGEKGWEKAQNFDYYAALEPTLPQDRDATKEDIQRAMRDLCLSSEFRDAAVAYSKDRNKRRDYERLRPPNEEEFEAERKRLREKLGYEPSHDQVVMSFRKPNTGAERTREARRQLGAF